ncbi:flagellar biosynthesis protein FlhA [candidate division KSB1 bacterium]
MEKAATTNPVFAGISKNSDVIMAVAIISVLVFMIIPIPTWMLDILLTMSITSSMIVLMVSIYITSPLELAVFPGLLLIMTLFRLSLNIASTRLILGYGFAGKIIKAFGSFVVAGNYVVGFIIFLILVLINFVVIVKGAGRIAEVAARFTLDAMPGKQMAIDADLNAGIINEDEARTRRKEIAREAEFHGAMDGASKFVKGDAIAGIIITVINIIGGFIIGMVQGGLSFGEAIETYTLLTVGDGLVSQIPSLIISTSAGMIVTRAAAESNLGEDVQKQILAQPKALLIAGGTLLFFGMTPGLPMAPFFILSAIVLTLGFISRRIKIDKEAREVEEEVMEEPVEDRIESYLQVDPMELEIGYGLIPLVDVEQDGDLLNRITSLRKQVALEVGFVVPPIRIRDNIQLGANDYIIKIRGIEIAKGQSIPGSFLAMNPGTATEEIEGKATVEPAFGLPAYWISDGEKDKAEMAGYTVVEAAAVIATHLIEVVKNNAQKILSRQDTRTLMDGLKEEHATLVEEVVPNLLSVGGIQKILQNLLRERVPIRDMVTILETIADYAPLSKDTLLLTEYVRQALSSTISGQYMDENRVIKALSLDPKIEQLIEETVKQAQKMGTGFSLAPDVINKLYTALSKSIETLLEKGLTPIVICSPSIRQYFRRIIDPAFPNLVIISYNELTPDVQVETVGGVKINEN